MEPAAQRFCAYNASLVDIHLGLVVYEELPVLKSSRETGGYLVIALGTRK